MILGSSLSNLRDGEKIRKVILPLIFLEKG
jgi:hypothetical protein